MNTELLALDPLLRSNVKIFISHLVNLERTENVPIELYNFHNHIIKFVEICGLIVGVDNKSAQVYYTVDDTTGTIPCCYWIESNFKYKPLELGTLVRVLGKIATYRGQKQIIIDDIFTLKNPNEELAHYIEKYTLLQQYKLPYELPTEEQMKMDLKASKLEMDPDTYAVDYTVKALSNLIFDRLAESNNKNQAFTMTRVRNDTQVIELARKILIQQGEKPEEYRIAELFNEAANKLMSEGFLSAEGTKNGLYQLVDKIKIEQFVLKTISDVCKSNTGEGGIHKSYIIAKLKENFNLEKKTAAVVAQITIGDLFEKGFIYPTSDRKYKVTFE